MLLSASALSSVCSTVLVACWATFAVVWVAGAAYNAWRGPRVRDRAKRDLSWLIGVPAILLFLALSAHDHARRLAVS